MSEKIGQSESIETLGQTHKGRVRKILHDKGFGYFVENGSNELVRFNFSDCAGSWEGFDALREGDPISFGLMSSDKKDVPATIVMLTKDVSWDTEAAVKTAEVSSVAMTTVDNKEALKLQYANRAWSILEHSSKDFIEAVRSENRNFFHEEIASSIGTGPLGELTNLIRATEEQWKNEDIENSTSNWLSMVCLSDPVSGRNLTAYEGYGAEAWAPVEINFMIRKKFLAEEKKWSGHEI